MAEYIVVRREILHSVPEEKSFEEAALTEPAAVAFNAVFVKSKIIPGDTVVIIGPGTIGLMALQMARQGGPAAVVMIGLTRDRARMELAQSMGADRIVYADKEDPIEVVMKLGDRLGADLVVDAVGVRATIRQSQNMVRPNGQITKIGWDANPYSESLDPLVAKAVTIQGSFSHTWPTWERVLRLMALKRIDTKSMFSAFDLEQWETAFTRMNDLSIAKAVLIPWVCDWVGEMKQAVMTAPGRIEFQDVPVPKPLPGEVLLRVDRIGICGSDVHVYHGHHQYVKYPLIQGRELAAQIEAVGEQVRGFSLGQKVTIQPQSYCGRCYPCTYGSYHICENLEVMGFQLPGCAREYMAVPEEKLIKLPPELSLDQGALIEPVAVAVHAVGRTESIRDKRVLVLGAGTIGNLVAQTAAGLGAGIVAVTDVIDSRLRLAARCGVAHCLSGSAGDVSGKIEDALGTDGADIVFDCAGVPATLLQAVSSSHKGADIIIVAVFPSDTVVNLAAVQRRELRLIGTHMYQRKDFELGIDLVQTEKIVLEPLITTHFGFQDYPAAYRYIDERLDETMKVIIHVSS